MIELLKWAAGWLGLFALLLLAFHGLRGALEMLAPDDEEPS